MEQERFINRLREIIKFKFDMSIKRYAEVANISESLLGKYLKGETEPGLTNIFRLANAANMSLSDLFSEKTYQELTTHEFDLINIPVYECRLPSEGETAKEMVSTKNVIAFRYDWIKTRYRADIDDLFLMFVEGDSMEPTLRHRDIILVNKREALHVRDGIYVLRIDGNLQAKRIARLGGQTVRIISDNPTYPFMDRKIGSLTKDETEIIGRVIWLGRQL